MSSIDRIMTVGLVIFWLLFVIGVLCVLLIHLYVYFKNRLIKLAEKNEALKSKLQAEKKKLSEISAANNDRFNYFNAVFTTMKDGILVLNEQARPILVNPAARIFLHIDAHIFLETEKTFYSDFYAAVLKLCTDVYKYKKDMSSEYQDAGRFFSVSALPIPDRYRPAVYLGVLALITDVSAAHCIEQRRKEFVSDVSHEFRTPMTLISGYAQMLRMWDEVTLKERAKALDVIEQETERLKKLVSELLMLTRLEQTGKDETLPYVDVEAVIDQVVWTLEDTAGKRNIKIKTDVRLDYPLLRANEQFMYQLVLNLIDNAIVYNKDGGRVTISAHNDEKTLFISVADTGVGMEKIHCERIFERFYRIDKDRNSGSGGTGIGLSIVSRIVQRMGGAVRVESEPDRGSVFFVELPLLKDAG